MSKDTFPFSDSLEALLFYELFYGDEDEEDEEDE